MIKVLNLYAGIGGNRRLWKDVEVTAIENNSEIAKIYQDFFPNDKVIVTDAHQFLLEHYKEFDFIWSSPPCPSHSKFRFMTTKMKNKKFLRKEVYPDMNLYQEILFLQHYFEGKFVVENVKPYYEPLIKPQECGRHCFWANFVIINKKEKDKEFNIRGSKTRHKGLDISKYSLKTVRKDQVQNNCVNSEIGLYILELAFKKPQQTLTELNTNIRATEELVSILPNPKGIGYP